MTYTVLLISFFIFVSLYVCCVYVHVSVWTLACIDEEVNYAYFFLLQATLFLDAGSSIEINTFESTLTIFYVCLGNFKIIFFMEHSHPSSTQLSYKMSYYLFRLIRVQVVAMGVVCPCALECFSSYLID